MAACPFQTLIGWNIPPGSSLDDVGDRIGCTVAVVGGTHPDPLTADMLEFAVETLLSGRIVLLVSDRADLRDYAKREIIGMASPAWGRA
jgi:hypothetical protein